ncbi:MAG: hypothetical protein E7033_00935 [Akkermansiaceae bacterium]|nr:hypothetical protein [Akkermansiaceae bacterium]
MSHKDYKKKKKAARLMPASETPEEQSAPVPAAAAENKPEPEHKTEWKPIIKDFLILLVIMGVLGYACNLLKDAFAHKSPTDSLVSLIRKGDVKDVNGEEIDEPFLKELKEGIEKNADFVNTRDANERTPLMWAAYANFNDPEKATETDINRIYYIDALFEKSANIHAADEDGFNALHWAAWSGMRFTSYKLVKKGVSINQPESNGYTPLMLAALRGNDTVVDLLLKMGANPNAKNNDGLTAAELATNAAAAYSKRDSWVYGPVYSENRSKSYEKTCTLLSENKGKITDEELKKLEVELEMEMLASQAKSRAERKISALAKKDDTRANISLIPLVSLKDSDNDLHHRVKAEAEAIAAMEKEYAMDGAVLNKTDDAGNTALHIAARDGKAYCCYHLVSVGLDVCKENNDAKTPLMIAVAKGHLDVVKVLVNVDKLEVKEAAAAADKMLKELKDVPNAAEISAVLQACNPMAKTLKDAEFESRREANDKEYAKAKADAAAKAKAEAEAAAKAAEEARKQAEAAAKAREEALQQAEKAAADKQAEAEKAAKHSHENSAMAVRAMIAADTARVEAQQAKAAAEAAQFEANQNAAHAAAAEADAMAVKAEAQAAKAEAEAAKAAADAAKAEAEAAKAAADAAKAEAEAAKAAADAAKAEAEAAKAQSTESTEVVAPVEQAPAA